MWIQSTFAHVWEHESYLKPTRNNCRTVQEYPEILQINFCKILWWQNSTIEECFKHKIEFDSFLPRQKGVAPSFHCWVQQSISLRRKLCSSSLSQVVLSYGWYLLSPMTLMGLNSLLKSTGPQLQVSGLMEPAEEEAATWRNFPSSRFDPSCLPSRSIFANRSKAANDPSVVSQRRSGLPCPLFLPTTKVEFFGFLDEMSSKWRSGIAVTGTACVHKVSIGT